MWHRIDYATFRQEVAACHEVASGEMLSGGKYQEFAHRDTRTPAFRSEITASGEDRYYVFVAS